MYNDLNFVLTRNCMCNSSTSTLYFKSHLLILVVPFKKILISIKSMGKMHSIFSSVIFGTVHSGMEGIM